MDAAYPDKVNLMEWRQVTVIVIIKADLHGTILPMITACNLLTPCLQHESYHLNQTYNIF